MKHNINNFRNSNHCWWFSINNLLVNKIKFNKELKNIVVIDPKVENEALKNVLKDRNKYIEYLQSQNENLSKKIKEFLNEKEK